MLKVVQENNESNRDEPNGAGVSLLDEIVRDGAGKCSPLPWPLRSPRSSMPTPTRLMRTGTGWWSATAPTRPVKL